MHTWGFSKQIRFRILLLTLFTIIPVIVFIVYLTFVQFHQAKELQVDALQNTSRLIAKENTQIIEGVRQLLITLSISDQITTSGYECSEYLAELLKKYKRYNNIAFADLDGNVLCSAVFLQKPTNVSERYFFRSVLKNRDLSIGEYSISPSTNKAILTFGYPVESLEGNTIGVIYASLDLGWLESLGSTLEIDESAKFLVLDKNGTILADYPDQGNFVGKAFPDKNLVKTLTQSSGIVLATGFDSVTRYYAFQKIGDLDEGFYSVVGLPESVIFNGPDRDFQKVMLMSIFIATFSVAGGWLMGNSLIANMSIAMSKVDQLKRDFVSLVSHQLRTPLTAIKYFNTILLSQTPGLLNNKQKEFLTDISASTNRLIFLVGTLLDISRLESGKISLNLQRFSIIDVLKQSQEEIHQLFKEKHLGFEIDLSERIASDVYADPKLITQVLANLLTNAGKYSSPKTSVVASVYKKNGMVVIRVTNSGIEIPPHEKTLIFSKFFRGENASKADSEGAGLGLYLSDLIVKAHGGSMWFLNSKKKTSFFFTLPVK